MYFIFFLYDYGFLISVISVVVSIFSGFNIIGILLSGVVVDCWSSCKMLFFLYGMRVIFICIFLYSYNFVLLFIFVVLFGLVDFVIVVLI